MAPDPRMNWRPRVFRSTVDGSVAVEYYRHGDITLYKLEYAGPVAKRLRMGGRPLTLEFLVEDLGLAFVELVPKEDQERNVVWRPDEQVPCGDPDKHCGLKGGTARCGGCSG